MSFEYLYHKLYPSKNKAHLIDKLEEMFTEFPDVLDYRITPHDIADEIKELRRRKMILI